MICIHPDDDEALFRDRSWRVAMTLGKAHGQTDGEVYRGKTDGRQDEEQTRQSGRKESQIGSHHPRL
jgi:hypothetical protein